MWKILHPGPSHSLRKLFLLKTLVKPRCSLTSFGSGSACSRQPYYSSPSYSLVTQSSTNGCRYQSTSSSVLLRTVNVKTMRTSTSTMSTSVVCSTRHSPVFRSVHPVDSKDSNTLENGEGSKPPTNGKKPGIVQRFKDAYKEYGKALIVVHTVNSALWFGVCYYIAYSGVDVTPVLETLHISESIISKLTNSTAGDLAVAYIIYELLKPVRYLVTLWGTRKAVHYLRRHGYIAPLKDSDKLVSLAKESRKEMTRRRVVITSRLRDRQNAYRVRLKEGRDAYRVRFRERSDHYRARFRLRRDAMRQSLRNAKSSFQRRFQRRRPTRTRRRRALPMIKKRRYVLKRK